jgi:hypothetical protein
MNIFDKIEKINLQLSMLNEHMNLINVNVKFLNQEVKLINESISQNQNNKENNKNIIPNKTKIIPPKIINNNVTIVIAHYNENLEWVLNLQYPFIIISKSEFKNEQVPNRGNEASSYLEYIINNYNNLTEYTLFVHGHRNSWHYKTNTDEGINLMDFSKPYYNINEIGMAKYDPETNKDCVKINNDFINLLISELKIEYNQDKHKYRAGGQFYVNKNLILKNPLTFYEKCYKYLMSSREQTYYTSRYFEYTWHMIFTHEMEDVE